MASAQPEAAIRPEAALDAATVEVFVRQHYDRLVGLARLVCFDAADAGDAVQAACEQAWRRRATLREPARLRSWLDRIVVREAVRLDRRRRSPLARFFGGPREIPVELPDHRSPSMATMTALRIAFDQLHPDQRAVIALHLHAGYSVAETAELVGAPVETVRSRLRLGRERLRRALEETTP
jgi:RNA polymerase sigma-70 factor (ECF subfamily)